MKLSPSSARQPIRLLLSLLLIGSCGPTDAPSPTPRDLTAVLEALALRGATVRQAVAGDAGCPSVPLHGNAVRLDLDLQADTGDHVVYLFRWRRRADFASADVTFDQCVDDYARQPDADAVETIELAPWRAYGAGWSEELREALEDALRAAGAG